MRVPPYPLWPPTVRQQLTDRASPPEARGVPTPTGSWLGQEAVISVLKSGRRDRAVDNAVDILSGKSVHMLADVAGVVMEVLHAQGNASGCAQGIRGEQTDQCETGGTTLGKTSRNVGTPMEHTYDKPNFGVLNASVRITTASIVKAAQ